jgi:hypothetical protein
MDTRIRQLGIADAAYSIAAVSGVFSAVAAGSTSAGHLFALRFPTPQTLRSYFVLQRLRAKWRTVAGFTSAQQVAMDLSIVRSYTAAHTGGIGTQTPSLKRATFPVSGIAAANLQIANTGALTNGTETFDAAPIKWDGYSELAAAATVAKGTMDIFLSQEDLDRYPLVLSPNEGIVIRNLVSMGAGGTAQLAVELDWLEVRQY